MSRPAVRSFVITKVLLVDDEEAFRTSLALRLNLRGYRTVAVGDGAEAVKAVREDTGIDVVVLDCKMPGMNGEQTLREIRRFRPDLKAIMLTGLGPGGASEASRMEALACLEKPCDLDELVRAIESARGT